MVASKPWSASSILSISGTGRANLFGDNVMERCDARGHSFVNYTFPSEHNNPPDAAAIFSRYANLLERLIALSVGHPKAGSPTTVAGNAVSPQKTAASAEVVTESDFFEAVVKED